MTFGQKLRTLRDSAGLSEAKLSKASGVSFASIHDYSLGRRKPSFAAVVKLAAALGVDCRAFADCSDMNQQEVKPPAAKPAAKPSRKKK